MMLLTCYVIINFQSALYSLNSQVEASGYTSRTLEKMEAGTFFISEGRNSIRSVALHAIQDSPLYGYGIFGDRIVLYNAGYAATYVHNIFLELLCDVGIPLGIILIFYFIYLLVSGLRKNDDIYYNETIMVILPTGLLQLFFSGSFLISISFFFLIGCLINNPKYKNDKINQRFSM